MGRKKIQIKQIPESRNKSVTFLKRKAGLIKKAWELSVLCSADVAVIIFGENGKAFEFCSCDIDDVLVRYTEYPGIVEKKPASELAAAAAKDAGEDPPDASDEDESGSETTGPKSKTSKSRQIASNLAAKRAGLPVGNAKGTPPPQLVPNLPSVNLTKNASASSSGARQTPNVRAAAGSTSNGQPSLAQFQGPSTAPPGSNGAAYYQTSRWQQAQQGQSGAPLPGQYAQSLGPGGHWDQQQQGRQGENGLRLDIPPNTFGSSSPQGAGFPFSPMFRNYNSSQLGLDGSTSQPPTLGFPANGGNPLLGNGTGTGGLSFDPASASNGNQNPLGFLLNGDRSVYGASNSIPNLGLNTFAGTDLLGSMFGNPMLNFGGLFGGTNPGAFNGQQQQQQPQQQQQHALYNHPMFANYNSQLNGGDAIGQQQQQQQQPQQGQPPPSSQAGVPQRSASMPSAGGFSWPQASSSSTTQPTSNLGHSSSGGGLATFPEGAGNGVLGGDEHDTPTSALEDGLLGGSSYGGLPTGLAEEGEERKRSASVSSTASDEDVNKRARLE